MTNSLFEKLQNTVTPAMATPIDSSGYQVSIQDIAPLVEFLIERGVGGLFPGGTTGEGILLSGDERKRLHTATVEAANGRVPVMVHVGTNNVRDSSELAAHAESIGADAIVAVTPYFYPLADDELLTYFKAVAKAASNTPFLAYDIPHFANNGIGAGLLGRISAEIPTFTGIKCSRGDGQMIRQLIHVLPDDKLFLAGNERILLGSLAMGANGTVSGLSTAIPEPFVNLLSAHAVGDNATAQKWHGIINQLLDLASSHNRIGGIKSILAARGVSVGNPIPPRPTVEADLWSSMLSVISKQ